MKISTGKVTAVVAAAAVAGAGYALGTQGDGGAVAANSTGSTTNGRPGPRGADRGRFVSALATKLGVTEAALRAALDKVGGPRGPGDHAKGRGNHEAEHAQALATALGVDVAKVRDALTKAEAAEHAGGRRGPSENLDAVSASIAQTLGLDVAKVKAALTKIEAAKRGMHDQARTQRAAALAKALGLPTQKVVDALASLPHPGPHGPHGPGGPGRPGPGAP
jgi:hypothetical protein